MADQLDDALARMRSAFQQRLNAITGSDGATVYTGGSVDQASAVSNPPLFKAEHDNLSSQEFDQAHNKGLPVRQSETLLSRVARLFSWR